MPENKPKKPPIEPLGAKLFIKPGDWLILPGDERLARRVVIVLFTQTRTNAYGQYIWVKKFTRNRGLMLLLRRRRWDEKRFETVLRPEILRVDGFALNRIDVPPKP